MAPLTTLVLQFPKPMVVPSGAARATRPTPTIPFPPLPSHSVPEHFYVVAFSDGKPESTFPENALKDGLSTGCAPSPTGILRRPQRGQHYARVASCDPRGNVRIGCCRNGPACPPKDQSRPSAFPVPAHPPPLHLRPPALPR